MASRARWRFGAGVFFLCMAFAAAPASAERLPPNPLTDGWQVLSDDESWVSSTCLGEMTSPQCVADTLIACGSLTAYGYDTRKLEHIIADDSWIGGYHPVCDPLRSKPGNPGVGPRSYDNTGGRFLLFYKVIPLFIWEEYVTRHLYDVREGDVALPVITISCDPPPECDLAAEGAKPSGSVYNPQCLRDCEDTTTIDVRVIRQRGEESWKIVDVYDAHRNSHWPYIIGFYEGLRYSDGLR
ncbi:MAG: hypothetical protein WEA84_14750 [Rhodovibrionaceae bacterium]